ncbi:hypothetical protein IU500_07100 [Nocardia terpenica]|uniref:hypothetical protein n=1 Tax=Nocardia terpenica TaxID=455432 RepID=UPI001895E68D|nr:hypothetical protein [Nocardia terpenica]MBF6060544.1 hypothetical protein [Nocardia terpenica]MBF6103804.1 hypothetical protein [Nocardia terpenica]MBF6111822.1 hypothetical protein [Nocardia terpenica]MBF6118025.1 hypothetical protein [Nocardia terpenica]MBF6155249.1 hypothetical protein [Nocardia terpenica]
MSGKHRAADDSAGSGECVITREGNYLLGDGNRRFYAPLRPEGDTPSDQRALVTAQADIRRTLVHACANAQRDVDVAEGRRSFFAAALHYWDTERLTVSTVKAHNEIRSADDEREQQLADELTGTEDSE